MPERPTPEGRVPIAAADREISREQMQQEFLDGKRNFDELAVRLMRKEGQDTEGGKLVHFFAVQYNLRAPDRPDTEIEILYSPGGDPDRHALGWQVKELTRGEDGIYRHTGIFSKDVRDFLHSDKGRAVLAGDRKSGDLEGGAQDYKGNQQSKEGHDRNR